MPKPKPLSGGTPKDFESGAHRNPTFGTYFRRLPLIEVQPVQLDRGAFDHRSLEIWGQNSILIRDCLTPLATFSMVPEPDWILFLWPHAWTGDFRVDGRLAGRRDVFYLDAEREWFTAGAQRDTLSLGVKRSVLASACASLKGVDHVNLAKGSHVIENSPEFCVLLQRIYAGLLASAPVIEGRLVMPPASEADMISALATYLDNSPDKQANAMRDQVSSVRVVQAVGEALRENSPAHLAISDLCRAAGVGRTRLHQSFVDVFGVSPGHYLQKRRLTSARERLLDPSDPARLVKEVALDLGFYTSGRFARDYCDMFGELPSETYARRMLGASKKPYE